jgi:Winged helix DNA-binding domain
MTGSSRLRLTREQALAFRRRAGHLDQRQPCAPRALRQAAWCGLQDSMPRAALLSIHARVSGAGPDAWADESLVQLWGPRHSVFVVPACDIAPFSLGTLPDQAAGRRRAEDLAVRLRDALAGGRLPYGAAGEALGVHPNSLRYAAATGTVLIRWEGARQPLVWTVPPPDATPQAARLELARRFLHVYGPATSGSFARWAGLSPRAGEAAFAALGPELTAVRTPAGDAWLLSADEPAARADPGPAAPARLLPSGDAYYLLQGADRTLLVPDQGRQGELWTPRVWPGALLVAGEVAGTWRRAGPLVTIQAWRSLTAAERDAVTAEAESLPLPDLTRAVTVSWSG